MHGCDRVCVCVTEPVCICTVCICVCIRATTGSLGEVADRDSEDFPRRPLAGCTRGHIRGCVLNMFYPHVSAIRWEEPGVCSFVYQSLLLLSMCVCVKTYLQIYFRLLPGSPAIIEEDVSYSEILSINF